MIKFFRHIRQQLLAESKFSKYLLYALGEIILVVIGILIALQINTMNESAKTKRWETKFLKDLQNELKGDYAQLKNVIDIQNQKGEALRRTIGLIEGANEKDLPKIDSLYQKAQTNPTFFPTTGVYDSGLYSGRIDDLKSDSLKYKIMNLYGHFYGRTVYNGEVLDNVIEETDRKEVLFFDRTQGKMRSWEHSQSFEFKALIAEELKQNSVYTKIARYSLDELEELIDGISIELGDEDIP